ncbi:hypothetical protein GCM10023195_86770 [Actinoallomurus liliacearum]|uniref:HTH luxR-type domain-containing protein n=1 Tax=Actinoallomurus liliacearum TaxID=1080073 RepID=A0ABP8TZU1_9ACTN
MSREPGRPAKHLARKTAPARTNDALPPVKTYVSRILTKRGLRDRVQVVVFAYQNGLVSGY